MDDPINVDEIFTRDEDFYWQSRVSAVTMQRHEPAKDDKPRYRADHSFVIQFQEPAGDGQTRGQIEHLKSGRARRFDSSDQLLAFVAEMLSGVDGSESEGDG